jgi:glycosyltransferase involved in cell wall biosynthesis
MHFLFVGSITGPEAGRLKCELRSHLGDYVHRVAILPAQRHEVLLPIVRHARLVVLPSRVDNLSNACLEAMGLGRVVIGTRGASFEQLIQHGLNGFLVAQDDQEELAATIDLAWRLAPGERERIGARAIASLERMRPDHAIANLLNYFGAVVAGKDRGRPTSRASSP